MTAPLLSKCHLTDTLPMTLLKEDANADASFLISSILGHRLRVPNMTTILVCCHQNFNHYFCAGQRLGYNLKQGNNLKIIDLCEGIAEYLESGDFCENLITKLWKQIDQNVVESANASKTTIIIDDLTFFKQFGFTDHHLVKLIDLLNGLANKSVISIVIKVNDHGSNEYLCNHIEDQSDVVLAIEKLKSGNFKDVDGQIQVRTNNDDNFGKSISEQFKTDNGKKFLYKINERNVKIYMPGEVGVKI